MKSAPFLLLALLCTACGSYKAVRPEAPVPTVAEAQNYSVRYKAADGQTVTAVYLNSHSPLEMELHQGNTVETLKQSATWTKGVEYSNFSTKWNVQEGSATLTRGQKTVVFTEIVE
ncbi:hypothetical protein [Neisseria perflava]|uniref:hypothetical protein n=1 Tax=Neisseria perflava TaxID=33053 RepID=UPI003F5A583B